MVIFVKCPTTKKADTKAQGGNAKASADLILAKYPCLVKSVIVQFVAQSQFAV